MLVKIFTIASDAILASIFPASVRLADDWYGREE
jgi:hypothetical protein